MLDLLRPPFEEIPNIKVAYNIGCLFDIPTGSYLIGQYGESIFNGGMCSFTGIVGIGNSFKSLIMHYMTITVMARFPESAASTYDTEINISKDRLRSLADQYLELRGFENNPIENGRWTITDKSIYYANEWYEQQKDYMKSKLANRAKLLRATPFLTKVRKLFMSMVPTITQVDSFTKFETEDVADMKDSNELGTSGANTSYMKQGASKARFLSDLPKMIALHDNPILMTAHVGKTIAMDPRAAPVKKLGYLKNGDTIKGVSDDFLFLTSQCWQTLNAAPYLNDTTKGPEYPEDTSDSGKGDTDLILLTLLQLRSKTGRSGLVMQILASQEKGLLAGLSEFHYIKSCDRFGLGGNVQNYYLELLPEVKLSRTVVRGKLDRDPVLRRAVNITSEMCQMFALWSNIQPYVCTPKELYDDLIKMGYDWNILLNTRGWWTFDNDKQPVPFLSTMDLLKMRKGEYHPYWLSDDKKTIKTKLTPIEKSI